MARIKEGGPYTGGDIERLFVARDPAEIVRGAERVEYRVKRLRRLGVGLPRRLARLVSTLVLLQVRGVEQYQRGRARGSPPWRGPRPESRV